MRCDVKAALDPVAWAKAKLDLQPDPWQAEVLRSPAKRILLNCSRQSGKSTITSALALHTAIYCPGSLTLCLSPTLRQSSELFHNVSRFYGLDPAIPSRSESVLRLELENGSRIVSLPGKESNVRGYASVNLLICDEASRIPDDLYYSVRPMLAVSSGRLIALSTPWGCRGWWYEAWRSSEPWRRWEIPASKCPRISPEFLAEEQRTMGQAWYNQEYFCKFEDLSGSMFRSSDIESMFAYGDEEVPVWDLG